MAEIRPFRALRYTALAGDISQCVCPPYDIISPEERAALIEKNEYNLVRLELPRGENRYAEAGATLREWLKKGVLARDEKPGLYIYRELFEVAGRQYVLTGLVGLAKLYDFSEKVILPHEETLKKAKADRFELMCATGCNFSSVYSLYRDESGVIAQVVAKKTAEPPLCDFTDGENVTHRLWKLESGEELDAVCGTLAGKQLFIADGHHRYETALNYREHLKNSGLPVGSADSVLMTMVDMDDKGLVVFPTHRLVVDMPVDEAKVAACCEKDFTLEKRGLKTLEADLAAGADGHVFAMYTGGESYTLLRLKKEREGEIIDGRSAAYSDLDVSVLHSYILERALGIDKENMANQKNLRYTRSAAEALDSVRKGGAAAAFVINATKVAQIKAVALAGDKMPQKSTYFYPKLITGLVMNMHN